MPRYVRPSVCLSVQPCLGAQRLAAPTTAAPQLPCRLPELCGLRIRPRTDVDPPRSAGSIWSCRALTCFNIFSDFCQLSDQVSQHLHQTHLQEIYRICRTWAVDKRSEVIFSIPQGALPWQPILFAKSTSNTPCSSHDIR